MITADEVRVGAASLNQLPLDWEGNFDRIRTAVEEALEMGVQILCLPELCITGYGIEDAVLSPFVRRTALEKTIDIAHTIPSSDIIFTVGLPYEHRGTIYNCVAVIQGQQILGIVPKQNLANDGVHYEPRWYEPWSQGQHIEVRLNMREVPFGDLIFEQGDLRFGFEICEDAWTNDRPGSYLSRQGANLILNPSASHFCFGKHDIRRRLVEEGSRAFNSGYVYANHVGNEAGRIVYDGGCMIASDGEMQAEEARFNYDRVNLLAADLNLTELLAGNNNSKRSNNKKSWEQCDQS